MQSQEEAPLFSKASYHGNFFIQHQLATPFPSGHHPNLLVVDRLYMDLDDNVLQEKSSDSLQTPACMHKQYCFLMCTCMMFLHGCMTINKPRYGSHDDQYYSHGRAKIMISFLKQ